MNARDEALSQIARAAVSEPSRSSRVLRVVEDQQIGEDLDAGCAWTRRADYLESLGEDMHERDLAGLDPF